MEHRHLDYPAGSPVAELGAAALDDLLDRGDLEDWAPLAAAVRADPHGPIAETVQRLCEAHPMYGTSNLWRSWIQRMRGLPPADVRRTRGLTQQDVAERMGISQSDVSKLERRADPRLSSLRAWTEATGGSLEIHIRYADGSVRLRWRAE